MDGLMKLEIPGGKLCLLRLDAVDDAQLARWETWLDPKKRARIGRQDVRCLYYLSWMERRSRSCLLHRITNVRKTAIRD